MVDTLSRPAIQSIDLESVTFELIADEQQKDAMLDKVKDDTSLPLKEHPVPFWTKTILYYVGSGYSKSYIPPSLRKKVIYTCPQPFTPWTPSYQ